MKETWRIDKRVCVPCLIEAFKFTDKEQAEQMWRMYEASGLREVCPLGLYVYRSCPHVFEQAVAAGMEKDDEGSGLGPQLLRLL